jgi:hypothetical protein
MNNTIYIPEPCSEKWASMKNIGNGQRHCDVCKTNVHNFSKSSLSEINQKFELADGQKLCGNYHERHIEPSKKVYLFVNTIENKLMSWKLKRLSIILITAILFLTGCAKRNVRGNTRMLFAPNKDNKQESFHV